MAPRNWLAAMKLALAPAALAQQRPVRIDVRHYDIEAEINTRTQTLAAKAKVKFAAVDDGVAGVSFDLANPLNVSRVTDESGRQVAASRNAETFSVRVTLPEALPKGKETTLLFEYEGRLMGNPDDSPVYGVKFANIQQDYAFLMYPARWFPVNEYTADRFTAEMKITVPAGMKVLGGGGGETPGVAQGDKMVYTVSYLQPTFPGSLAVVRDQPPTAKSGNVAVYFRGSAGMANTYADEIGKAFSFFSSAFGLPPFGTLTVVETETGSPNGYAAPGLLFLSPRGIGKQANQRLIANQAARQWWGVMVSPTTRNHLWITNGMARYSEILYLENLNGPAALENEVRDIYVEAMTVDNPPLIQTGRLEDYSPEFWALTASKGAAVWHMLRYAIGEDKFGKVAKAIPEQMAWKSINTDDVRKFAEDAAGQNMQYFFLQWIESSGAPEFKMEYTVFRTQKGFRVMGKITQDLDTFRMPVELKIETEGNPEEKKVEVMGVSSEFTVDTFGKPKRLELDPNRRVLRMSPQMRIAVAVRRGEQFAEIGEYSDALREYQRALDVNRNNSLAHYRVAEIFFLQNNYQSAANEFREALNGDLEPKWTEVWSHINLGKIFDITGQRERAVNEYNQAVRTKDNTQDAQGEADKYLKKPYERPRQDR